MMKRSLLILLSSLTLVSASQSGVELFKQCGACHGYKGEKHSLNVTNYIAGMDKDDVIEILHEYKNGTRNKYGLGSMMKGQAGKLSDEDMDAVASYVESLPEVEEKIVKKEEEKTLDGKEIFKKCAVCHGVDANKRSLNVSKFIAGMDKDHIIDTLHGYQSGKINQYGFGRMMKGQAKKLSEEQLEAVALYVQSLKKKKEETATEIKKRKRITQEEIDYNKFLKEHFDNSKDPNETYEEGKRKWLLEKEKLKQKQSQEAKETKTQPAKTDKEPVKTKPAPVKMEKEPAKKEEAKVETKTTDENLDAVETAGEEKSTEKDSSWYSIF